MFQILFRPLSYKNLLLSITLFFGVISLSTSTAANSNIKQRSTIPVYDQQEKVLGQHWLRSFRGQVRTESDPLLVAYIENLIQRLVQKNENNFSKLSIVLVDSPEINAFAVPGGIIGVNLGIFLSSENEGQLASILAHELAHLSERHYSRMKQQLQDQRLSTYAGLLLSISLAAAGSAEGAQAVLAASQAAALQSQLRFSRQHEQEADHIGMRNLVASGYQKEDMVAMFESLQAQFGSSEINSQPPEYLLTHPLPNTRINEIRQLQLGQSHKQTPVTLPFQLLKTLVEVHYHRKTGVSIETFAKRFNNSKRQNNMAGAQAAQLGMAVMQAKKGQYSQALPILEKLTKQTPNELIFHVQFIKTLLNAKQSARAVAHLKKHPHFKNTYPYKIAEAAALKGDKQYAKAQQVLFRLLPKYKEQPLVWYLLAETSGQLKDNVQMHESRAEYYMLSNRFDAAKAQLQYALASKQPKPNKSQIAALKNKLVMIEESLKEQKRLGF